ncbi:uncharacterized protein isoform X2 [Danio rerio]|uniref:Uncharacterized protein isoform X2 n=1 Tax=Danio rerio TaxID=7955 RepID=A0AB32TXT6_DANRE
MEEQTVNQLDNMLLQFGIETRELAQRKDDLKQQIQICESNIQEMKDYISKTQKSISKLDEDIQQKQTTVKFIKENTKNLQRTQHLLLQYEKTLEAELEKRQDNYNHDMKMFQERMESYRNVFLQHKDRYCQNPLAQNLLKVQAENEEIESRIRAIEGQIMEKETELTAALGKDELVLEEADSYENRKCQENDGLQNESDEMDPQQDAVMERPEECADEHMEDEDQSVEIKDKTTESESQMDTISHGLWTKREIDEDDMHEGDQASEEVNELEGNVNVSCTAEIMVEASEEKEEDHLDRSTADVYEDLESDGVVCPPPSPARIQATPTTPTFSLNNSPNASPGRQEISHSKSPAFVFSMNSGPGTPAFSKLGCDFDVESAGEEASPFNFTSSYFNDKKSPGSAPKFTGFLFDEGSCQDEFSFSFGAESPRPCVNAPDTAGPSDSSPFFFRFGKL